MKGVQFKIDSIPTHSPLPIFASHPPSLNKAVGSGALMKNHHAKVITFGYHGQANSGIMTTIRWINLHSTVRTEAPFAASQR
ncbi:hypothetical protein DES53_107231 [Roseimicrobium gellanilyticum]|uniref:Uncharacterized protein n=1 Tax=Roseimicrobium gellanilyticum TaxID=748857 RepID=A0A366HIG7_9BACT|nr:hypothetical protein DES53_107231 [Roseimicrobium gellanilyticum]